MNGRDGDPRFGDEPDRTTSPMRNGWFDAGSPLPSEPTANHPVVQSAASDSEQLQVAARTAMNLSRLLQELAGLPDATNAGAQSATDLPSELLSVADTGLSADELRELSELVESLVDKPSDLLVMVKLAEQSEQLSVVLRAHRRTLELLQAPTLTPSEA